MKEDFENKLQNLSKEINVLLNEEQLDKFYKYMNLLLEWNEKMNLTAITDEDGIILKHFVDSLTVLEYLKDAKSIIDVGTGAGFPGIPISIMNSDKTIVLMDSLNKRINFLNDVVQKLNLDNVRTVHSRAEDLGQNNMHRQKYDVVISRAVANLTTLAEYMLPLTKIGGMCICMKGQEIVDEIKNSKYAIELLGGEIETIDEFCLPNSDMKRNIIIIRKIKNTDRRFPRKAGMPSKEPILFRLD